jgi:hypothetical protein
MRKSTPLMTLSLDEGTERYDNIQFLVCFRLYEGVVNEANFFMGTYSFSFCNSGPE